MEEPSRTRPEVSSGKDYPERRLVDHSRNDRRLRHIRNDNKVRRNIGQDLASDVVWNGGHSFVY